MPQSVRDIKIASRKTGKKVLLQIVQTCPIDANILVMKTLDITMTLAIINVSRSVERIIRKSFLSTLGLIGQQGKLSAPQAPLASLLMKISLIQAR